MKKPADKIEPYLELTRRVSEEKIARIVSHLRDHGIEPILIKGWAAASFYPKSHERLWVDLDFAVDPDDFPAAENILRERANSYENVDLHAGLRGHDDADWQQLRRFSKLAAIGDCMVRVLAAEDHLRLVCVHWLTDGGAYREKLWDIYYAVKNRPNDFDWERCLEKTDPQRKLWIICAIGLAQRYLGLELKGTPIEAAGKSIPSWVWQAVEHEWGTDLKLRPLESNFEDKTAVLRQLFLRIRANPVQALVMSGGSFAQNRRLIYRARSFIERFAVFFKKRHS